MKKHPIQRVNNLLDDSICDFVDTPISPPPQVFLTYDPVEYVCISCTNTKYAQKPKPIISYWGQRCPHLRANVYPHKLSISKYILVIEEGRLLRHYYSPDKTSANALDIANLIKARYTEAETIKARRIAYEKVSKGKMQANYLGTVHIVKKYGYFHIIYFDIDDCPYDTAGKLYADLKLKPNIIYEGYSHGSSPGKYSYHLVYIFDKLHSCNDYSRIYDSMAAVIRSRSIKLDNAARSPCQIIYGTCNKVYLFHEYCYHVSYTPIPYKDDCYPSFPITANDIKPSKKSARKSELIKAFFHPRKVDKLPCLVLDEDFKSALLSGKGTHDFLDSMADRCIVIDHQCNLVTEPFVWCKKGLLAIKLFYSNGQTRAKLVLKDGRKKQARLLTQLYLTMCPQITNEDLVYNVIRVLNMTCDWSAQMSNTYSNVVLLAQIEESYLKFRDGKPLFKAETIEKFRDKRMKRAINPYYFNRLEVKDKWYYTCCHSGHLYSDDCSPVSDADLSRQLKAVYPNAQKGKPRTKSGKLILKLHKEGLGIAEIKHAVKEQLGKDVDKKTIRRTIKRQIRKS